MKISSETYRVDFLLIENFSMISFASAVEPLRIANKLLGREMFDFRRVSLDGGTVSANGGLSMQVEEKLNRVQESDRLVVCSSDEVEALDLPGSLGAELRRLDRHGTPLGAICTGTFILAKFGLLRGRACTIHWEYIEVFRELFPDADLQSTVCVEDGNLLTCSGGTAPLDMMIRLVRSVAGDTVARNVADIAIHHNLRDDTVHQRLDLRSRLSATNPVFLKCVELMEDHIEEPLDVAEMCRTLGISIRQLQRIFKGNCGVGPRAYYESLKLERARQMLKRTAMAIPEISVANGFPNTSTFSKAYKRVYNIVPSLDRDG